MHSKPCTFIILSALLIVVFIIISCDQDERIVKPPDPDPTNQLPVIRGMSSDATSVLPLGATTLYCDAYDPDVDDTLIYNWISLEGIFPTGNDRPAVAWQGPDVSGYYIISVIVSDGQDSDSSAIGIEVR